MSSLDLRKLIEIHWLKSLSSGNCGMFYRRIVELIVDNTPQSQNAETDTCSRSPVSKQRSGKRKKLNAFDDPQQDFTIKKEEESDSEDDIHKFRRVHIKPKDRISWSTTKKHPSLRLQGHGLELRLHDDELLRSLPETAVVASATKPLGGKFSYFEIEIIAQSDTATDYIDG